MTVDASTKESDPIRAALGTFGHEGRARRAGSSAAANNGHVDATEESSDAADTSKKDISEASTTKKTIHQRKTLQKQAQQLEQKRATERTSPNAVKKSKNDVSEANTATKAERSSEKCPRSHFWAKDKVLPEEVTHGDAKIPRVVHLFVRSRCLPVELALPMRRWTSLANHTILFHDEEEVGRRLALERPDLPFLADAARCAVAPDARRDLARAAFLYDVGGYAVDSDHVPGPAFQRGRPFASSPAGYLLEEEDAATRAPRPRFLAARRRHLATHATLVTATVFQFLQFARGGSRYERGAVLRAARGVALRETQLRNLTYVAAEGEDDAGDGDEAVTLRKRPFGDPRLNHRRRGARPVTLGIVRESRMDGALFLRWNLTAAARDAVRLGGAAPDRCPVDLQDASHAVDAKSLLDVVGMNGDKDAGATCPDGLVYVPNTFRPESLVPPGRKIPKVVHVTSKTRCFTEDFARNVERWRFEGYSLFVHDDPSVERLLAARRWPQFPLLREARACLSHGAAVADLWRYLVIWEYGGIYTDIDDAPGSLFANGTRIKDKADAFFEVDRTDPPSQYFFAGEMRTQNIYDDGSLVYDENLTLHLRVRVFCQTITSFAASPRFVFGFELCNFSFDVAQEIFAIQGKANPLDHWTGSPQNCNCR